MHWLELKLDMTWTWGVSVYVKDKSLYKGDYETNYAVKGTMKVDEYASIYDNNKITRLLYSNCTVQKSIG